MSRTVIDLDDEALEAAARELGTSTKRDTINTALREVTARYRRLRALDEARELVAEGALDIDLLLDKSAYRPTSAGAGAADDDRGAGAHE
jgi:Arc/MetJ family transcription regulator